MPSEVENNNLYADANSVTSGLVINGDFSNVNDNDWFKISANAGETITIEFDWKSSNSYTLDSAVFSDKNKVDVFDSATNLIARYYATSYVDASNIITPSGFYNANKVNFSIGAKTTGPYYINLTTTTPNIENISAGYTLTVDAKTTEQIYDAEPNDYADSSNTIFNGKSVIGQLISRYTNYLSGTDIDVYKIQIPHFKRSGIDGDATITISDYENISVGSKIHLTLSNGAIITLQAETEGVQSSSNRNGNTIYFRPNESNNTTADNIYSALNNQPEFTLSNPESNVVTVSESSTSTNTYLTLATSDAQRLSVTSPIAYPDVVTLTSEYSASNHIFKIKDAKGFTLKVKDSNEILQSGIQGGENNSLTTFDILKSGDYFIEVTKSFGAPEVGDYKFKVSFSQDQPNQENITLGATFATATDLGKISDLDEKWITFKPNGESRGFFKVTNDLTFENYDRLFLRFQGDGNDNYGVKFYDTSGEILSSWLPTLKGQIDFGMKSQHQAKAGELYYGSNNAVVEIYETSSKTISSDLNMIAQHFSPKTLSSSSSLSDSGQYTVPSGAKIYTGESLYSLINSDGLKLSVSKSQPVVIVLKPDISQVVSGSISSNLKKSNYLGFLFQGFDAENVKKVKIKAYDKVTGLSLDSILQTADNADFNTTGAVALISTYAVASNDIVVELSTDDLNFTNGWFLAEPIIGNYPGTTTSTGNLHPDMITARSSNSGIFGSLGPDKIVGYGDNNVISGWTGNDLILTGEDNVSEYKGNDIKLADDFMVFPYTGNDIINIERNLDTFSVEYTGIHYPNESLEIGYDNLLNKFMIKGETFADIINKKEGTELNNFAISVGSRDSKTKPITVSSSNFFKSNIFAAEYQSSPELWDIGRIPDKYIGDKNIYDVVQVESTVTAGIAHNDVTVGINNASSGLKVSTKLSSGKTSEILNFSNVEALLVGNGNDNIEMSLETNFLSSSGGNDIISTSSSPDIVYAGTGDDKINISSENVWGSDSEAWNIDQNETIFYKIPIDGKLKYEDIILGEDGTDTLNMLGSSSDAVFLHDVISGHAKAGINSTSALQAFEKARITGIETINAGEAGDVIDLTSPDFTGTFNITINGDAGHDVLWGNKGDDKLNGGDGDDLLFGGEGQDHLTGGIGKDIFEFAAETLTNTPPHDVIADYNKSQGDLIRFYVQSNDTQNLSISGTNELTWQTSIGNQTIHLNGVTLSSLSDVNTEFVEVPTKKADRYVLHDSTNGWSLANLVGTKENDTLTGSSAIDKIVAGQGDDIITGGGGKDIIYAGPGDDKVTIGSTGGISAFSLINGGSGADTLFITSDTDTNGNLINLDISHESGTVNLLKGFEVIDISQSSNGAKLTLGRSTISKMDIETNPIAYSQYSNEKNVLVVRGGPNKNQKLEIVGPTYKTSGWTKHGWNNDVYTTFDGSESYYLIVEHLTLV